MRKLFLPAGLFILLAFVNITELSQKERDDAASYFKETASNLAKATDGLSENQLKWKPNDSTWSIADCIEHIALSEETLFNWAMATLKEDADPSKRADIKLDDEKVKQIITDRTRRFKTREPLFPKGKFGTPQQTLKAFNDKRSAMIEYIGKTKDDLRNHFAKSPIGFIDTYQFLLFLSGHSQRHILQIIELKGHPDFPKQ